MSQSKRQDSMLPRRLISRFGFQSVIYLRWSFSCLGGRVKNAEAVWLPHQGSVQNLQHWPRKMGCLQGWTLFCFAAEGGRQHVEYRWCRPKASCCKGFGHVNERHQAVPSTQWKYIIMPKLLLFRLQSMSHLLVR